MSVPSWTPRGESGEGQATGAGERETERERGALVGVEGDPGTSMVGAGADESDDGGEEDSARDAGSPAAGMG